MGLLIIIYYFIIPNHIFVQNKIVATYLLLGTLR